jgi:hypothetical protein
MVDSNVMYLFDNLPLDLIRFEIFPYLDWTDRVAVNACLPPSDRIRTPLAKDSGLIIVMKIQGVRLRKQLISSESVNSLAKKARWVLKIFRGFEKYNYLIQHHKKFRDMLIQKCKNYSNPENPEYIGTTRYIKKTLVKLCADIIEICEAKYPYKYEVNPYKDNVWNPIQNRYVALESK